MLSVVRTTLNLPDALLDQLKRHARESGRTVTSVVEEALRDAIERSSGSQGDVVHFPVLGVPGGTPLADLSDRQQLLDLMDGISANAGSVHGDDPQVVPDENSDGSIARLLADIRPGRDTPGR